MLFDNTHITPFLGQLGLVSVYSLMALGGMALVK